MTLPRIVAIANQKGGVGKTATTVTLASFAARAGARVLVMDLDLQANATEVLEVDTTELPTMADLMLTPGAHVSEIIVETSWKVDLAPAESTLARVERELQSFKTLRKAMDGLDGYDVVLMDCPPSLGALTRNALTAATQVLAVTTPTLHSLDGMGLLSQAVGYIRNGAGGSQPLNPGLSEALIDGVVVNMVDRTTVARHRTAEVQETFGDRVWAVIPTRAMFREALELSLPLYDPAVGRRNRAGAEELVRQFEGLAQRVLNA